jgi:hypothetical protein
MAWGQSLGDPLQDLALDAMARPKPAGPPDASKPAEDKSTASVTCASPRGACGAANLLRSARRRRRIAGTGTLPRPSIVRDAADQGEC